MVKIFKYNRKHTLFTHMSLIRLRQQDSFRLIFTGALSLVEHQPVWHILSCVEQAQGCTTSAFGEGLHLPIFIMPNGSCSVF